MNREQKRTLAKNIRSKGVKKELATAYAEIIGSGTGSHTPSQEIAEGEKVMLNVEAIKARKFYPKMTENYKRFIEENKDTIFTAHTEQGRLISFDESPQWLFWSGDLVKVSKQKEIIDE